MDAKLLQILRCSQCHGALAVKVYEHAPLTDTYIQAGLLTCQNCGVMHAIWQGVPRMNLEEDFRLPQGFVTAYRDRLSVDASAIVNGKHAWEQNPYDVSWSLDSDGKFDWGGLDLATRRRYFYHYL
jgi:uncharacterized protein YbaR (Trm112 family)